MRTMANYNQAPILRFDIPKNKTNLYYELPQHLMDIIFSELGNCSAQIKIMIVLVGTKPDTFQVSEKWILDRTGLSEDSYKRARKALIDRGWLSLIPGKELTVHFKNILKNGGNTASPQSKNRDDVTSPQFQNGGNTASPLKNRGSMISPQRGSTTSPQRGSMVSPIIDKEQIINTYNAPFLDDFLKTKKEKGTISDPLPISANELEQYNFREHDLTPYNNGLLRYKNKYFKAIKEEFSF